MSVTVGKLSLVAEHKRQTHSYRSNCGQKNLGRIPTMSTMTTVLRFAVISRTLSEVSHQLTHGARFGCCSAVNAHVTHRKSILAAVRDEHGLRVPHYNVSTAPNRD